MKKKNTYWPIWILIVIGIIIIFMLYTNSSQVTKQIPERTSSDIFYTGGSGSGGNAGTNPETDFISFKFFDTNHNEIKLDGLSAIVSGRPGVKYLQITTSVKNTGNSILECTPTNFTPSSWDLALVKTQKKILAGNRESWTSGDIDLDILATDTGKVRFTATVKCTANGVALPEKSGYGELTIRPNIVDAINTINITNSYDVTVNLNDTFQCANTLNITGLSLYLPFNSNVNDYSGNNFNGVIYGPTFITGDGKYGDGAYSFDGTNDYIEVPDEPQFSPSNNGNQMTVSLWIKPRTFTFKGESQGYNHFMGKGGDGNDYEWMWRIYNSTAVDGVSRSKRVSFYGFNLAGGLGAGSYFQDSLAENEWIFITGVFDGTNVKLYKNGILRDTDPLSGYNIVFKDGTAPVRIGTSDKDSYFAGSIDEVRIYNHALTANEILQIYNLNSCTYT